MTMIPTTDDRLRHIITELMFVDEILDSTDLIEELGMDSITFVQLITLIEAEFNIEIADEDLAAESFSTIASITDLLIKQYNVKFE